MRFLPLLLIPFCTTNARSADVDYLRDVKPIFEHHCFACHAALRQESDLRLDTAAAMKAGEAIIPGNAAASRLLQVVRRDGPIAMPPEGEGSHLTAAQIAILTKWIEQGAPAPADEQPQADPRTHWSYRQVVRPAIPMVRNPGWLRTPVDAFIADEHDRHGLTPQVEADRAILLRRVSLDLIGLPPTREQVLQFLADDRPDAYERVVDELLASPLYGQRWGRHWMDVWRYSDWYGSRGINEIRYSQRHIWRWRDWIVDSLNAGQGYDQMLREMLAGDELAPGDPSVTRATGFIGRNWYKFDRNVWMFDAVEHTAQAFMGVTLKCCRCHDHKYDPLSQQDYYQFRAFFEPHEVRLDPLSGNLQTEKDATLGPVLLEGVSQVYDKTSNVPTYLFRRGDNRYPDETRPLAPNVPAIFGVPLPQVDPVELPREAWYPVLKPSVVAGLRQASADRITAAAGEVTGAETAIRKLNEQLAAADAAGGELPALAGQGAVLHDAFDNRREDVWSIASGDWVWENGALINRNPGHFTTAVANVTPPRDFCARIRYRTLDAGVFHSVGVFFDLSRDMHECQAIYSATNNTTSTIQAFHRQNGTEVYPQAGIVPWPIKIGDLVTVDLAVRDALLNVWVNGELAIVYTMPHKRHPGRLGLWTHAGAAEFHEFVVDPLPSQFVLAQNKDQQLRSPFDPQSRESLVAAVEIAKRQQSVAEKSQTLALAEQQSLDATLKAESARVDALSRSVPSAADALANLDVARHAAHSQRQVAVAKSDQDVIQAENRHAAVLSAAYANEDARAKAIAESQHLLDIARNTLNTAQQALANHDPVYTPLGTEFPQTSTGRRSALAEWITDPRNPRTARVAGNYLWMWHFGQPLVPTVANHGVSGQPPSHPELLDWLATELIAQNWDLKPLHRMIVTSSTYRLASTERDRAANREIDSSNRYFWRANWQRMEAEVVRDSVWHLADRLDPTLGGPEIPEGQGEQSSRRSLYFRNTPNEKMPFLQVFDVANPNECFRRQESVVPQQALALSNSLLSQEQAEGIARRMLSESAEATSQSLSRTAFLLVLNRPPTSEEQAACMALLDRPSPTGAAGVDAVALQTLIHVLLNHNDFVTIR